MKRIVVATMILFVMISCANEPSERFTQTAQRVSPTISSVIKIDARTTITNITNIVKSIKEAQQQQLPEHLS